MKFLLSLIYTSTAFISTATPIVMQNAKNINKIRTNKNLNSRINIEILQESFITFYNTIKIETKTQLAKIKQLFNEVDSSVNNLISQVENLTNLDIYEKDDTKIVSHFNKVINIYEQTLRMVLSHQSNSKTIVLENNLESYDSDSKVRLYTRAFNSAYNKITGFFWWKYKWNNKNLRRR